MRRDALPKKLDHRCRHARGWAMAMKALGAIALYVSLAWAAALLFLQSEHLEDR